MRDSQQLSVAESYPLDVAELREKGSKYEPASTQIKRITYSGYSKVMLVDFCNAKTPYVYYDVPDEVFEKIVKVDSAGKFFASNIRGVFRYQKVETDENGVEHVTAK